MVSISHSVWGNGQYVMQTVTEHDVKKFLSPVVGLKINGMKAVGNAFKINCGNNFTITLPVRTLAMREYYVEDLIKVWGVGCAFAAKGYKVHSNSNKMTIQKDHVRVIKSGRGSGFRLYIQNCDRKWIMESAPQLWNKTQTQVVECLFEVGLKKPAPPTKEELLEKGIPDPFLLMKDGRISEDDGSGRRQIQKTSVIHYAHVKGIVTIQPDRTIKDATDPNGEGAWFQVDCVTYVRGFKFTVLSDGTHYYVMSRIGKKRTILESTKINSMLNLDTMTRLDQVLIQEGIDVYLENLGVG
jgi:hypothetical protein